MAVILGVCIMFAYSLQPGRAPLWLFDTPDGRAVMSICTVAAWLHATYRRILERDWGYVVAFLLLAGMTVYNHLI